MDLFEDGGFEQTYEERVVALAAGLAVRVRERAYHVHNANRVWPGTAVLAAWLAAHPDTWARPPRPVLELGAATGVLSVFLTRLAADMAWREAHGLGGDDGALALTTSDYADDEIGPAIASTFALNGLPPPPHWAHTWGTLPLPPDLPRFRTIVANDVLLYVKQYPNLVATLVALLRHGGDGTAVVLSCQRRLGQADRDFLALMEAAGAHVAPVGPRIYRMTLTAPV
jgi:hypothetical protein